MKHLSLFAFVTFTSLTLFADEAMDLLKASDQRRGGINAGISWKAKVDSVEDEEKTSREFTVKALGEDALVEATAPARNKGEVYVFNAQNMWFFKPSLKKPVSISARQKLTGQAANGDIASTNYAKNYIPTLEREENLNGEPVAILMLKAKTPTVTYDKIRYWVSKTSKLALKADFLTLQGKEFKRAKFVYDNTIKNKNETLKFISQMIISDAKRPSNVSTIIYSHPQVEDFSPLIFNINNLGR